MGKQLLVVTNTLPPIHARRFGFSRSNAEP